MLFVIGRFFSILFVSPSVKMILKYLIGPLDWFGCFHCSIRSLLIVQVMFRSYGARDGSGKDFT
jgi:hypothetical protein